MPDSIRRRRPARDDEALTAAAKLLTVDDGLSRRLLMDGSADRELWDFYNVLGEFGGFIDWMAKAMSRVRLTAAEQVPGAVQPAPVEEGPAAQLMQAWYGGVAGQAEFMMGITPHLLAPGQGWVVAERFSPDVPLALASWSVQSTRTLRNRGSGVIEVEIGEGVWRQLMPDAIPLRIWVPDPQRPYLARSPSLAALPIMRRIQMMDNRIVAELLSRLVMNGVLWIPAEATIPPPSPEFEGQPNPFMANWVRVASHNVQNPTSASAALPIPTRFPAEFIDKIRHDKFADPMDEHLIEERNIELGRLAKSLPLSEERQRGFGDSNHWNGFIVNEDDIKISIAPLAEMIANGITVGWLQPMLAAAGQQLVGPNGGKLIAWPDYSELASKPDKSAAVREAYDRGEASGDALRRESGLDPSDKPDSLQQVEMILLKAARDPASFPAVYEIMTGQAVPSQTPVAGAVPAGPAPAVDEPPASTAGMAPPATGRTPSPAEPPAQVASGSLIDLRARVNGRAG